LEDGKVLYFPELSFVISENWAPLLRSFVTSDKAKNISYDPVRGTLRGTGAAEEERRHLQQMLATFSATVARFVSDLLPAYACRIEVARASFRSVEIAGREYSQLKDDRLLHIDAFPSTPTRGRRILRFFTNINPRGEPRVWRIGELFDRHAVRFQPSLRRSAAPVAWFLAAVGATRGRRSLYDELMLGLHDAAKRNAEFQKLAAYEEIAFPAGSSWMCFTDQVLHAAVAGRHALEQTFYLDVAAMAEPDRSPLRTLERMTRRKLC
jgi:3-deoxy-D-manno-oct-2-ulosonic acid (Kdo) hydroxylase